MKRFTVAVSLCVALFSISYAHANDFSYEQNNAFMATIAGTPLDQTAPVPAEVDIRQEDLSVSVIPDRELPPILSQHRELTYRLAWQEGPAPMMFLIAGTGSGFDTTRMDYLKRVFWQAGMHVIVISSPTNYDFIAAASDTGLPGLGYEDARDLHTAMSRAVERSREVNDLEITEYHMAGFSLGALNAAFVGELDSHLGQFDFESILLLNPPVNLYSSVQRLDALSNTKVQGVNGTDSFYEHIFDKLSRYFGTRGGTDIGAGLFADIQQSGEALTDAELAMLVGAVFRFAAADLNFVSDLVTGGGQYAPADETVTVSTSLTPYLRRALFCDFGCYIETQLWPDWQTRNAGLGIEDMAYRTSLRSIEDYLRNSDNIAVVTNADDFILARDDYQYLADVFGDRAFLYPRGGHGGNLQHQDVVARMLAFVEQGSVSSGTGEIPEYRDPLEGLEMNSDEAEYQFERSSLRALKVQDPLEGFNRQIYRFNGQFDEYVYLPVVRGYVWATPAVVRTGVSNVFNNLGDVPNLANSLAQGKVTQSMRTTARLLLNTTVGLLGIFDVAGAAGLPQEPEDFGQTMGRYGAPMGPYLVVPFLGPSSLRDATGSLADWTLQGSVDYLNNRQFMADQVWPYGLYAVDLRYQNDFRYGALDSLFEYDQVRYLYTKLRELQIQQ
ncbi:hypothetical protein LCGC14_0449370 [marine sediment metagenome]